MLCLVLTKSFHDKAAVGLEDVVPDYWEVVNTTEGQYELFNMNLLYGQQTDSVDKIISPISPGHVEYMLD